MYNRVINKGKKVAIFRFLGKLNKALYATFRHSSCFFNFMTSKEKFLEEHNSLSPVNLKATIGMLNHFKREKASLFKDRDWSIEKLRRPFILWVSTLSDSQKSEMS
ncbi:hypothetical protein C0584_00520 [Candidatus Parcubacteria bacterium]|nr:MAG: hypothetical protein C0584_00520 [Candidatus Parcubacteria bacterium]